jgi:hypothetical protein
MISSVRDDEIWEVLEVGKFGRIRRPECFGSYEGL